MGILYFIVPLATVIICICGYGFFWAVKNKQFDDLEGPAHRILFDDDDPMIPFQNDDKNQTNDQNNGSNHK